jgi:hypothetical protein
MNDNLTAFRTSANTMRSGEARAFDGDFVSFNGETGGWRAGKNKTDIDGRQLVADVFDLLLGWQKYKEKEKKTVYAGCGFVRDGHQPSKRNELDERDSTYWQRHNKDPWQLNYYLAMGDPETREQFIYSTNSGGGKNALAALQTAFADHNEDRAPDNYEWPVVELASDSYVNSMDKKIFKPIFDIVSWEKPPAWFRPPKPPATTIAAGAIEHKPDSNNDPDDGVGF